MFNFKSFINHCGLQQAKGGNNDLKLNVTLAAAANSANDATTVQGMQSDVETPLTKHNHAHDHGRSHSHQHINFAL